MADSAHVEQIDLKKLHKQGACLTRHRGRKKGHKCSHQWGAQQQTEANASAYNYPKYEALCAYRGDRGAVFRTAGRLTKKSRKPFPPGYAQRGISGMLLGDFAEDSPSFWKAKPTHEGREWDVGKKSYDLWGRERTNFEHYLHPYWHNSHHIVPNGDLKSSINEAAKDDSKLAYLIKRGLLKSKYNLNADINMINLPMDTMVAYYLALPRHLRGDKFQVEPGEGSGPETHHHTDYNRRVQKKLKQIVNGYKGALDKAKKNHKPPPDKLSKAKLEKLSKDIFAEMIAEGYKMKGKAVSDAAFNTV